MPLPQLGPPAAFHRLRQFLTSAGYTEAHLLAQFSIAHLDELLFPYGLRREALHRLYEGDGLPQTLARLLMGGFPIPPSAIPEPALHELGLLETTADGQLRSPFLLFPTRGLYIAADRPMYSDGSRAYQAPDYVMSGAEPLCRSYVDLLPPAPCETFLDLGCGSGVAALSASCYARRVWASDITSRAVHFAEFNRRLNGVDNVTLVEGDLFSPFEGRRFHRIASNPPFEPPLKQNMVFSVGGEDGEAILARLIAQAPQHLEPAGRLYCLFSGTDRLHESFDQRVRRWLGEHSAACDVALFIRQKLTPREYAIEQMLSENADSWKIEEWSRFYQRLEAVRVLVGLLVIQRAEFSRPVFHVRHDLAPQAASPDIERLLDWETRCRRPGIVQTVMASTPRVAPGWKLTVGHAFNGASLEIEEMSVSRQAPFDVTLDCNESLPRLLTLCDGSRTARQLFDWLSQNGAMPGSDAVNAFVRYLCDLAAAGFLSLDQLP